MASKVTRHRLEWAVLAGVVLLVAWLSLRRLQHEKLFLIRLPWDRAPLTFELHDAADAARTWMWPALIFLVVALTTIAATEQHGPLAAAVKLWRRLGHLFRLHPRLCGLFAVACGADCISTLVYFHSHRIDDELHPGIKLFTYAYGLSIGCFAGKAMQALLALVLCAAYPRISRPILIVLIAAYTFASIWNLCL